jgi:hypothetical protein
MTAPSGEPRLGLACVAAPSHRADLAMRSVVLPGSSERLGLGPTRFRGLLHQMRGRDVVDVVKECLRPPMMRGAGHDRRGSPRR